jgi:hypothetical protein
MLINKIAKKFSPGTGKVAGRRPAGRTPDRVQGRPGDWTSRQPAAAPGNSRSGPNLTRPGWALIASDGNRCRLCCCRGSTHGTRGVGTSQTFLSPATGERGFVERGRPGIADGSPDRGSTYPGSRLPFPLFPTAFFPDPTKSKALEFPWSGWTEASPLNTGPTPAPAFPPPAKPGAPRDSPAQQGNEFLGCVCSTITSPLRRRTFSRQSPRCPYNFVGLRLGQAESPNQTLGTPCGLT